MSRLSVINRTLGAASLTLALGLAAACTNETEIRTDTRKQTPQKTPAKQNSGNSGKTKDKGKSSNQTQVPFNVGIYATSNPDGANKDYVVGINRDLNKKANLFTLANIGSMQSLTFDDDGNALLTYDGQNNADGGALKFAGTPEESGKTPKITTRGTDGSDKPKGLLWVKNGNGDQLDNDVLIVADVGDDNGGSVRVYDVTNDTPSLDFTVTDLGDDNKAIWDIAYDSDNDRLFATRTDGVLLMYLDFFQNRDNQSQPIEITPVNANGNKVSTNLHGIVYDADEDIMVLSDVGDAKNATDGMIIVFDNFFENIANQGGAIQDLVTTGTISGSATKLGNPVDILVRRGSLYVAEKSNDLVMRFDDIFNLNSDSTSAANASISVVKPESLAIMP